LQNGEISWRFVSLRRWSRRSSFAEGDDIEIHIDAKRRMSVARKPRREELIARLRALRGRIPDDFKFDRDAANAR
jgi:hypothetical protein